jgi:hypothetical protein
VVNCGGDTDTMGAIVGSIVGANSNMPNEWIENIKDYPINKKFLENISNELFEVVEEKKTKKAPFINPIIRIFRNILFFVFVLFFAVYRIFRYKTIK